VTPGKGKLGIWPNKNSIATKLGYLFETCTQVAIHQVPSLNKSIQPASATGPSPEMTTMLINGLRESSTVGEPYNHDRGINTFENRKIFITHIMEHTHRKVKAVCKFGGCSTTATPVEILDRDEWSDHLAEEHGLTCFYLQILPHSFASFATTSSC
jgi:hypothetical protein